MSKFESSQLIDKVNSYLSKHQITPNKGSLVLAVSGGVDSMVLLYVLHLLKFQIHVVHVNYHQRNSSSDLDQALVEKTCQALGISFNTYHFPEKSLQNGGNFQDEARQFRHHIFRSEYDLSNAQAIALGHNKGDRLETILMRILRGASPSNWNALKEIDLPLIRPLIELDRIEIQAYAQENGLTWREDESNFESDYARNFIRNDFFSRLDHLFPGWQQNLERVASYGLTYQQAMDALSHSNQDDKINIRDVDIHPLELQMAILHRFLERNGLRPSLGQVHQVQQLLQSQAGKELSIDDAKVARESDTLCIVRTNKATSNSEQVISLQSILDQGYQSDLMIINKVSDPKETRTSSYFIPIPKGDFLLRPWRNADRIAIKDGSKLISDLLNEWDIPSHQKQQALVLTLEGKIIACIFRLNTLRPLIRLAPPLDHVSYPCLELYLKL